MMSKLQREKHIQKVMSMAVSDTNDKSLEYSASGSDTSYALSADLSCLSSCLNIPLAAVQAIGKKASELLATM